MIESYPSGAIGPSSLPWPRKLIELDAKALKRAADIIAGKYYNVGARMADDVFSPSGVRGRYDDPPEFKTYLDRLYGGG